jgi:KUP system potassium uptake protein
VLSAIQGLETFNANLSPYVVPITIVILLLLFLGQRFGTSKVGAAFGPFMLLWFAALAGTGLYNISLEPSILTAFNPWEGIDYLIRNGTQGFLSLGAVFLAVTGLEALYADLGHFGKNPIRFGWLSLVLPALILNYLGQGAVLILDSSVFATIFFVSTPTWMFWPMLVLSTIATVIASQGKLLFLR